MRKTAGKDVILPLNCQVKTEAVQTIIERMGVTKAAIFLRETMSQQTDYLALKKKLFAKASAADVQVEAALIIADNPVTEFVPHETVSSRLSEKKKALQGKPS